MPQGSVDESLPPAVVEMYRFPKKELAFRWIHTPQNLEQAQQARTRFKMEELIHLQIELLLRKTISMTRTGGHHIEEIGSVFHDFYENALPFPLTNAQKRVLKEIRRDMGSGFQIVHFNGEPKDSGRYIAKVVYFFFWVQ